ncbi:MAG: O-antigen ligase family protein [Candidatus Thiodiazotropha sp.]
MSLSLLVLSLILIIDYTGAGYHYAPFLNKLSLTLIFSLLLFLYLIIKNDNKVLLAKLPTKILIILTLLTAGAMAYGFIRTNAIEHTKQLIGYCFLFVSVYYITLNINNFRFVLKIIFFVNLGLALLNRGMYFAERVGEYKAGYFLMDGNDFAWSLLIALPLGIYLAVSSKSITSKLIYYACSAVMALAIFGTQSRGAFIALVAIFIYYGIKVSKRKVLFFGLMGAVAVSLIAISPGSYLERIKTIKDYRSDSSAMGRLNAWGAALDMAIDNPVLGVGAGSFNSAYGRKYKKSSAPDKWISVHSIYLKTLAEYGFTGLILLVWLLRSLWKTNKNGYNSMVDNQESDISYSALPLILNASLLGFATAGVFLGGLGYPHIFVLAALTLSANSIVSERKASEVA